MSIDTNIQEEAIIWERQDGLYSSAVKIQDGYFGFAHFVSGFKTEQDARDYHLTPFGANLQIKAYKQSDLDDKTRASINRAVQDSCEALTLEEYGAGKAYGQDEASDLTENERNVIKDIYRIEYSDSGVYTPSNWTFEVVEHAVSANGTTLKGAAGVIGSLNKKGYFQSVPGQKILMNSMDDDDSSISFTSKLHVVNAVLNA